VRLARQDPLAIRAVAELDVEGEALLRLKLAVW
jgi:hypothetical protein